MHDTRQKAVRASSLMCKWHIYNTVLAQQNAHSDQRLGLARANVSIQTCIAASAAAVVVSAIGIRYIKGPLCRGISLISRAATIKGLFVLRFRRTCF
jgi:hypothetical protein